MVAACNFSVSNFSKIKYHILIFAISITLLTTGSWYEDDKSFLDMVKKDGYAAEEHNVTTEDGYIITLHRIPPACGLKTSCQTEKPIVMFLHGLFAASDAYVFRGPGEDLVYLMADKGYDLWIVNVRGNYYSRHHQSLRPSEKQFWRFSWHEYGVYDATAAIDYILQSTNRLSLSIIGHSMGTSSQLALLSVRPEYNDKVDLNILFAPVAIISQPFPGLILKLGLMFGNYVEMVLNFFKIYEILPRNFAQGRLYRNFCKLTHVDILCQEILFNAFGLMLGDHNSIRLDIFQRAMDHYPLGTSVETLMHYRQIVNRGNFTMYDFGTKENYRKYNQSIAPEYPLHKVVSPVISYYGQADAYSTHKDNMLLLSRLPNATAKQIQDKKFQHFDFLFHNDSFRLVYNDVINQLDRYLNRNVQLKQAKDNLPDKIMTERRKHLIHAN